MLAVSLQVPLTSLMWEVSLSLRGCAALSPRMLTPYQGDASSRPASLRELDLERRPGSARGEPYPCLPCR